MPNSAAMPSKLMSQGSPPMPAALSTRERCPRCIASNFPKATIQRGRGWIAVLAARVRECSGDLQFCRVLSSTSASAGASDGCNDGAPAHPVTTHAGSCRVVARMMHGRVRQLQLLRTTVCALLIPVTR